MSKPHFPPFQKISPKIIKSVADIFFPASCFGCGKADTWLCEPCEYRIPLVRTQRCFHCQRVVTRFGEACMKCEGKSPLDAVFSASCYHIPALKRMVHTYKYQFVESLAEPLGRLLAKNVEKNNLPLPDFLVPVPLHSKRLRYRGFNQSELLCKKLTENIGALHDIPAQSVLTRTRYTKPQQKTDSREERGHNLTDAFQIDSQFDTRDQVVWLIDDVATTHSTLTECARVLKSAGAEKVYAVVLAQD